MKFLILAVCVCAASAATYKQYKPYNSAPKVPVSPFAGSVKVVPKAVVPSTTRYAPPPPAPVVGVPYKISASASGPVAKVANSDAEAEVVSNESEFQPDGSFSNHYETNNGIYVESSGVVKIVGDTPVLSITGSYKYKGADGNDIYVTYVADENGFQPQSDSLPVAPPVPEDIARAVEYVIKNGKPEDQGNY